MKSLLKVFWVPVAAASLAFSLPWNGDGISNLVRSWVGKSDAQKAAPHAPTARSLGSVTAYAAPVPMPEPGVSPHIFVELSRKTVPSVVNIFTRTQARRSRIPVPDPFFGRFPGFPGGDGFPRPEPHMSLGTGFVIEFPREGGVQSAQSLEGIILTNNHVIEGADEIKVQFTEDPSETPTDARVIGRDPELDIALLQVKTSRALPALVLGDSDKVEVGEYVMAVGNPFGQGHSVTHGIVSAKGRVNPHSAIGSYLQTDAMINPGNSGGPLLNLRGEVVGVNTAIDPRGQGIGFAIPANLVKGVLPQLQSKGTVSRGYIGIGVENLRPEIAAKIGAPNELRAPFAAQVSRGSPASAAGVEPYDVILEVNGQEVQTSAQLVSSITAVAPGADLSLTVLRNGKKKKLSLKVKERPSEVVARSPAPPGFGEEIHE